MLSERLIWRVSTGIAWLVVTRIVERVIGRAWRAATGETPPDPSDPSVPARRAFTWAIASGVSLGLIELALSRALSGRYELRNHRPAPKRRHSRLG